MGKASYKKKVSQEKETNKKEKPKRIITTSSFSDWKSELIFLIPALLLGVLLYVNVIDGAFVYDDVRQITKNPLIQDSSQIWRALSSDVWAYKSGGNIAASNYWRPTFVLWLIINFKLFGIDSSTGWHITNILLNACVIALAYFFLRRLEVSRIIAGAIVLVFAAHPVHTESVAWISGSPDLLLTLALLGSLWFVKSLSEARTPLNWALALVLYAIALGAKEVAILFPLIVFVFLWNPNKKNEAVKTAAPFALLAVAYFILRLSILGSVSQPPIGAASFESAVLSLPSVFTFYLRQLVFPYWIGPSYPLRPVTNISLTNFIIPLAVSAGALFVLVKLALRSLAGRLGFVLFLLPLLPAMNITAFLPEQIVHDRYLYFPLLGFLMIVVPALAKAVEHLAKQTEEKSLRVMFAALAVCCVPLSVQSFVYNEAWMSNISLWEWGTKTDPTSSFNFMQYGAELVEAKRYGEAKTAYDRSIEISPNAGAYMGRARIFIEQKKFADAESDLQAVIKMPNEQVPAYVLYQSYESFAVTYQEQAKLNEAFNILIQGRTRLPQYAAALTEKIAIVLYQGGQKEQALVELEKYRAQARNELLPESRFVFYRLGLLYAEFGRKEDARAALQEYLSLTQGIKDKETTQTRIAVQEELKKLQ